MNNRQKIALLIVNLVLVVELCYSMYLCSKDPENLTSIFFKWFFLVMIPTFIVGRFVVKRLRSKEPEDTSTAEVSEPGVPTDIHVEQSYPHEIPLRKPFQADELKRVTKKMKLAGKIAAFFLLLVFVAILDSCFAKFRQPINVVKVLPGNSVVVNGPLDQKVNGVQDLYYESDTDLIQLSIDSLYSGFWFGGIEWSGLLTVSPHIETGTYNFKVMPKIKTSEKPPVAHHVWVYPDETSLRKSSTSFIRRYTGFYPWWAIAVFFPLTVVFIIIVYFISRKNERLMEKGGEAEVFWMRSGLAGKALAFGLGSKHGVKEGDRLFLYDEEGKPAGTVVVHNVYEKDSIGIVGPDCDVRHGYIVSMKKG